MGGIFLKIDYGDTKFRGMNDCENVIRFIYYIEVNLLILIYKYITKRFTIHKYLILYIIICIVKWNLNLYRSIKIVTFNLIST